MRDAGRKIDLTLVHWRVRHRKPVKAGLAAHKHEIEVFDLPSESPEPNPDEMANATMKQAVTELAPARTELQLVKASARHLSSVQRQPERIKSRFQPEPVRYAAWIECFTAGSIGRPSQPGPAALRGDLAVDACLDGRHLS